MSIKCRLAGHRPAQRQFYNSGYWFSACAQCGEDLVRTPRGRWHSAPAGHRIVWKSGRHAHSIQTDYAHVLPVAVPTPALPARQSPFASWARDLMPWRGPALTARRGSSAAIETDSLADFRCSRALLVAVMLGAGLKMLLTFGGAR